MENINKKAAIAALGLVAAMLVSAQAAAITYDTNLAGTNVTYHFNQTDLGLFGTASIVAGNLVLTPTQFEASTSGVNSAAATLPPPTLNITVTANSGYQLSSFTLTESGGYSLTGDGSAYVVGSLKALDIEGNPNATYSEVSLSGAPLSTVGDPSATWAANAAVNLPATGWGGSDGIVGSVGLSISNKLMVTTGQLGGTADVWKSLVTINTVVTSPVPEANTYAMMLVGLGLVGFMARRTRASV